MDCWIVALRGREDALVEARAAFGSPQSWLGTLEIFACETVDPGTAATLIAQLATTLEGVAGGVTLEGDDPNGARERAAALACAAGPGEFLFERAAVARMGGELLFVRARPREGWRLPVPASALAPFAAQRADCRDALASLPARPPLVGRAEAIEALVALAASEGPIAVRAPSGWGGGRVIEEAADRLGCSLARVPQQALADADGLWRALPTLDAGDWLVVDPVTPASALFLARLARKLPPGRRLIVRGDFEVELGFVPDERIVMLGPMRGDEPRQLVRALLGAAADERLVRSLARRGGFVPRRIVEMVRASVQLGELVPRPTGFAPRARRAFGSLRAKDDPLTARVRDLPDGLARALPVLVAVGDGAREIEALAALRGAISPEPVVLLEKLEALALIERHDGRIALPASLRALYPADDARVIALARAGALEPAARAELLLKAGRSRDAAPAWAQAATAALGASLRAAAVRFASAAGVRTGEHEAAVTAALKAVALALGPVVVVTSEAAANGELRPHGRTLDPISLEHAAAQFAERNDAAGEARMRALAELMRGNSQRAMRISDADDGSSKAQLVAALAQGAAGELPRAVRTALAALARARHSKQRTGEAAALALLSALYRAAGREDDARTLAEGARRVPLTPPSEPAAASPHDP